MDAEVKEELNNVGTMEDTETKKPEVEKSNRRVSVVLAGYNESDKIEQAMEEVYSGMEEAFTTFELILVDDASKDDTISKMQAFAASHAHVRVAANLVNLNFGTAVLRGMKAAAYEYIVYNACDLPLSVEDMVRMVRLMDDDCDMLVLERVGYKTTKWRGVTSRINQILLYILYPRLTQGTPVLNYVQIIKKSILDDIMPLARSPIFVWPEMVYRAKLKKYRVDNKPCICNISEVRSGAFGHPHDIIWGMYDMFRFRIRSWFGKI